LILKALIKKNLEIIKKYNISKKFNINVNFFDLKHKGIVESIIENKDYFNVEFLENSLFDDYIDELCILKETGVTIFLDDFGSDKSITNYFNDIFFENIFSFIKLDKIFVKRVLENEKEYLKLKKIIDLFKLEDKKIVVEWIENEKIYALFKPLSIDYYQGFYLSKPLSLEDMLLNEHYEEIGSNRRVVLTNTAGKNVLLTCKDKYTCYAKPQQ
jgi:EAL domain-containing protein (putative c-di-GMP-specific phosphodiesterase class I)